MKEVLAHLHSVLARTTGQVAQRLVQERGLTRRDLVAWRDELQAAVEALDEIIGKETT